MKSVEGAKEKSERGKGKEWKGKRNEVEGEEEKTETYPFVRQTVMHPK
jgi:hypothetical protein